MDEARAGRDPGDVSISGRAASFNRLVYRATIARGAAAGERAPMTDGGRDSPQVCDDRGVDRRVGEVLGGRYRILERLSAGAMGEVYRAERVQLGRVVAVKFLHPMVAASPDLRKRFELEAQAMSRLDHPHCVAVIDFGVADSPYIVMEYVSGATLRALIDDGPVPPPRALAIARQLLAGLAHAHEKGIVHRDIKPANVMLAQATGTGDHVRILDFGLAKLRDDASASMLVVGTPSYMSPEQAACQPVDARSDLYGVGVLLFELLTGEKPFVSDQAFELARMHVEAPPPALAEEHPTGGFSAALEALVARALAKSPGARFQTAGELAAAIEELPEWSGGRAATAGGPRDGGERRTARGRAATLAGAARQIAFDPTVAGSSAGRDPGAASASTAARRPRRRRVGRRLIALVAVAGAAAGWFAAGRPGLPVDSIRESYGRAAAAVDEVASAVAQDDRPEAPRAAATIAEVERMIAAGDREGALGALHGLRRQQPNSGRISYLMGALYFEKRWWAESVAAYREAIEKDARYRRDQALVRDVIAMLADDRAADRAQALLVKQIGEPALPQLREAARGAETKAVRARALALAARLARPDGRVATPVGGRNAAPR
jgi:serine/threonine-protein kinase